MALLLKLLVIDDNEPLALNLQEIFQLEGYEVGWAPTAERALELAASGFDLAILDVRLPDAVGTRVVPQLKTAAPNAEVVIMTANADLKSAIEAVEVGAFAYLTKPVRPEELILTVERARERIELRHQLESSELRLRTLVENVQAVIVLTDEAGEIRFINSAVEEILGWSPDEVIGKEVAGILAAPEYRAEHERFLATLSGTDTTELDCAHRDGTVRRLVWRWTRVDSGQGTALYGTGTDVTQLRDLERRTINSEKLAAAGTLTAGLAHEIRNPLNAAGLQLAVLARTARGLPKRHLESVLTPVQLVRSELHRLDALFEDFLAFARPRMYEPTTIDLVPVVRRVIALLTASAAEAERTLSTDIDGKAPVLGDANALQQLLMNLVQNAIDACRSRVEVRIEERDGAPTLIVDDDGPGIPPKVRARMFEPFFTTKPAGSGLGMAIAHAIAIAHGGQIAVEPREHAGTAIAVSLQPAAQRARGRRA